jgi:hypothetical protein
MRIKDAFPEWIAEMCDGPLGISGTITALAALSTAAVGDGPKATYTSYSTRLAACGSTVPDSPSVAVLMSGGASHLAGFADWMRAHGHLLSSHKRHQGRPYGYQTEGDPGRGDVCTHRALSASTGVRMATAPPCRCDLGNSLATILQPTLTGRGGRSTCCCGTPTNASGAMGAARLARLDRAGRPNLHPGGTSSPCALAIRWTKRIRLFTPVSSVPMRSV